MKAELKSAMIFVKDLARMRAFYEQGLGLEVIADEVSEGWVPLRGVSLHQIPAAIAANVDVTATREDSAIKLVFRVASLEVAREHLIAHGAVMGSLTSWARVMGTIPRGTSFSSFHGEPLPRRQPSPRREREISRIRACAPRESR